MHDMIHNWEKREKLVVENENLNGR